MTKARMYWRGLELVLKGHANSAPKGQDMVCCAESMLTQALLQTLIEMEKEKKTSMNWAGSDRSGCMCIRATPAEGQEEIVRAVFRVCVTGLRMLAEEYPQYIELKEE